MTREEREGEEGEGSTMDHGALGFLGFVLRGLRTAETRGCVSGSLTSLVRFLLPGRTDDEVPWRGSRRGASAKTLTRSACVVRVAAMSILRAFVLAASLTAGLGCGSSSDAKGSATAAASAPASPPSETATAAPKPADDLDIAPLVARHKCPPPAKTLAVVGNLSRPCWVLGRFASAKAWTGVSPGGEGRFLGRYFTVKDGKTDERYAVLRTRTIPTNEAGAGRVPARIAITPIASDDPGASSFEKAIAAFERGDVPAKGAPAIDLVKSFTTFTDLSAMPTRSGQVVVLGDEHMFVALGSSQAIYLVAPRPTGGTTGDGIYAVFYPISW